MPTDVNVQDFAEDRALAEKVAAWFKALADPVRLRLLNLIVEAGEAGAITRDLVPHTGLAQPTVSHHLRVLRTVGILDRTPQGRRRYYTINQAALAIVADVLTQFAPKKRGGKR